jgi:hypothetical protein
METRQSEWCQKIAGKDCGILLADPWPYDYTAWVNWADGEAYPVVFWNQEVLHNWHWFSTCRIAHEACHIAGIRDEDEADRCASEHTKRHCRFH